MKPRLQEVYENKIRAALKDEFKFDNAMQIPKLEKITINMGLGSEAVADSKVVEHAVEQLALITGQKPVITRAKKSEAIFKLRQGMPIGCKVTLRRKKMYEFLDRFVNIALPRVRDFRGYNKKSFDRSGNFSVGFKEQIIFPEIDYDKIDKVRGLDITFNTSAKEDEHAKALLKAFNIPFKN